MIDFNYLDDLVCCLSDMVLLGLCQLCEELQVMFKIVLQVGLGKLDLVICEEFDVQCVVLLKIWEKLEVLEKVVVEFEVCDWLLLVV